jgi:hypothetical protein
MTTTNNVVSRVEASDKKVKTPMRAQNATNQTRPTGVTAKPNICIASAIAVLGLLAVSIGANGQNVSLGAAENFTIVSSQGVTNSGPTVITGNIALSPLTSITGFTFSTSVGAGVRSGSRRPPFRFNLLNGQGEDKPGFQRMAFFMGHLCHLESRLKNGRSVLFHEGLEDAQPRLADFQPPFAIESDDLIPVFEQIRRNRIGFKQFGNA